MADFGSALWNKPAAADSTPADPVTRSLRFEDGGSPYLVRAASDIGTPTDAKKVTVAFWFKLGNIVASRRALVSASSSSGSDYWMVELDASHRLRFQVNDGSASVQGEYITNRVFRDPAAWTHICLSCDSTAAEADRAIIYVNGVRETSFSTTNHWPADWLNEFNEGTYSQYISSFEGGSLFFDGLIADVYNIDGHQLEPTDFIEANDYGGYKPIAYTGSFGTNGFHIDAQPSNSADLLVSSVGRNDGDTTFVDVAAGHTITTNGDTEHSIAVGNPFTGDDRAIYFDGTGDNITTGTTNDFNFGTGDFTIECWVNPAQAAAAYKTIIASENASGYRWQLYQYGNALQFWGYDSSSAYQIAEAASVLTVGQWHHIAVTRASGTLKIFVNGSEEQSSSNFSSHDYSDDDGLDIGSAGAAYYWQGYMYDVRVVNGTAYTPPSGGPTSKLTAVTNTKLLLQPDKGDSSWGDESGNQTLTGSGDLSTVSPVASSPYEAAAKSTAMYFDGSGYYLQTSTSSDLTFGTGDFTVETWFYPTTVNTSTVYKGIISDELYSSTGGWAVSQRDDELSLWIRNTGGSWVSFVADGALTANQWQHIAVSYDLSTTTTRLFVDGTVVASGTTSGWNLTGDQIEIGRSVSGQEVAGYLFDVRATKGTARYTSNFTAPSAPFELNPVYLGGDQSGNKNHFTPTGISSHDVMLDTPTKNYCVINPLAETQTSSSHYTASPTTALTQGNLRLTSSLYYRNGHGTMGVSSGKWYFEWYQDGDWVIGGWSTSSYFSNASETTKNFWGLDSGDVADSTNVLLHSPSSAGGNNSTSTWDSGHSPSHGNVFGCAFDVDNRKMYFHKNGEWSQGTGTLTSTFPSNHGGDLTSSNHIPLDSTFFPLVRTWYNSESGNDEIVIANFGQDSTFANTVASGSANAADENGNGDFRYTPPSGYLALCSASMSAPSVTPAEHFNTVLYTGTRDNSNSLGATSNAVTGMGFEPSLLWIKDRDNQSTNNGSSYSGHYLFDTVQGTGKAINIDGGMYTGSNDFVSNLDGYNGVSSFDSDGFTLDEAEAVNYAVDSTGYIGSIDTYERYAAWGWKLGSNGSSSTWASGNTDPTTEKYNDSAGVSVIRQEETSGNYPMTGVTVNHSLGAAPEFAFLMDNSSNTQEVFAWHKDLDANKYLKLTQNSAQTTGSGYFPSGCSTATTFQIGGDIAGASGYDGTWDIYLYLFSGVEGYSKFGSYTGNGNSGDAAPFIYTGFRPAFVLWKRATGSSNSWNIMDNKREGYNPQNDLLFPDSSTNESNVTDQDLLSNGFKLRTSGAGRNANDETFIYAAWAEVPFARANAR